MKKKKKKKKKTGIICPFSMFTSRFMVLELSKTRHFLKFCADLSKKSKSIKAIDIHSPENSCCTISENVIVYYAITYRFGDIRL